MSYRLITKATLEVTTAAGKALAAAPIELRAYPQPKRDAVGQLALDGESVPFRRTGGKGRGTVSQSYIYLTVKGASAFALIPSAHAESLSGATVAITTAKQETPAPASAPEQAVVIAQLSGSEPTSEPVVAKKGARRVRKEAVAA